MRNLVLALFIGAGVLTASLAEATTFHVNNNTGSNSNTCAQAQNRATPKKDISTTSTVASDASTNAVTCMAAGDELVITNDGSAPHLTGRYCPQDCAGQTKFPAGSTFRGEDATVTIVPTGLWIFKSANNNITWKDTIFDCDSLNLTDQVNVCLQWYRQDGGFTTGWTITGNDFKNSERHIVLFGEVRGFTIRNNKFHGSMQEAGAVSVPSGNCLYFSGDSSILEYNEVYDCGAEINTFRLGMWINDGGASHDASDNIVRYNNVHDIYGWGIGVSGARNKVHHNRISNARKGCVTVGWAAAGPEQNLNNEIYNNTCYYTEDDQGAIQVSVGGSAASGTVVKNNILVGKSGTNTSDPYVRVASLATNTVVTHNHRWNLADISNSGTNTTHNNGTSGDPLFTNFAGGDYTLTASSPVLNNGTAITGSPFNGSAPERGRYETYPPVLATMGTRFIDLTVEINRPEQLPLSSTPVTGLTVSCAVGANCGTPTVLSATVLSAAGSVIRAEITGITGTDCESDQTWKISASSSNLADATGQKLVNFTDFPVTNNCGDPSPVPPAGDIRLLHEFDDGTGTSAADTSGFDDPATLANGATFDTGKYSGGVLMNGSDDRVTLQYGSGIDPTTQDFTVCFGVLPASGTENASGTTVFGIPFVSGARYFVTRIDGTWRLAVKASLATNPSDLAVHSGWNHLCIENNQTTNVATLILDGVPGAVANASLVSIESFTLGGNFNLGHVTSFNASTAPVGDRFDRFKAWTAIGKYADEYLAWEPPTTPPAGTYNMAAARGIMPWLKGGSVEYLAALNTAFAVRPNGYFAVDVQVDGDGAAVEPAAFTMHYQYQCAGEVLPVPNTLGAHHLRFLGTSRTGSNLASTAPSAVLTGVKAFLQGQTLISADAVPVTTFTNGSSVVNRYFFQVGPSATPTTDYVCIFLKNQNGTDLDGVTPAGGLRVNVMRPNGSGL